MYIIIGSGITFFISFFIWCMKEFPKSWKLILLVICSLSIFILSCYKTANDATKQYWYEIEQKNK